MEKINNTIKERVIDILNKLFSDSGIDRDVFEYIDLIDDLGMDSISFVSLMIELETEFKIQIPDDCMMPSILHNCVQITNAIDLILNDMSEDSNA